MIHWRPWRRGMAAAAMACAAIPFPARAFAQDAGPTVFTKQRTYDWLSLNPIHGNAEVIYRGQRDQRDSPSQPSSSFSNDRFEENLTLRTTGAVYHPNLVFLDLSGTFGLFQEQTHTDSQNDNSTGTIYSWNANAQFLRTGDVVPSLYTRRNRQLVNRQFGPTLSTTTTTEGAAVDIHKPGTLTHLEAYHLVEDQSAPDEQTSDFHLSQDVVTWHTDYHPDTRQVLNWDYTYNNVSQNTGLISNSFASHDANLSHSVNFGRKDESNLTSTLRYFNQSGDFSNKEVRWEELLRLRHTDSFETYYRYTFDKQSFETTDQTTNRADVGFTHRLFKSLVTDGNAQWQRIDSSGGFSSTQYSFTLDTDYRKKVPLGELNLNAAVGWTRLESSARTSNTQVLNQPATFGDVQPIVLTGSGINPNSIVVTDPSGLLVFIKGLDYDVVAFPNRLELDRIVGGRINPNDAVLIDYQFAPQPANMTTTNFFSLGSRYDIQRGWLKGVGVYARYAQQSQDVTSSNVSAFVPNEFKDIRYGIDYKFWLMQVGAEQQLHDSTISPFDATRLFARLSAPLSGDTSFNINSTYDKINYTDEGNEVRLWLVSAQMSHRFTRSLSGIASVLWRDETTTLNGDSQGWEEQLELQWRHRQTYIYAMFRNATLSSTFEDNSFQFFELGLRREF